MPPYQGGGDMISSVTFEKTIYNKLPFKFEAGTLTWPARSAWARPSNISTASEWTRSRSMNTSCSRTPPRKSRRFPELA